MSQLQLPSSNLNTLNTSVNNTYPSKTWLISNGKIVGYVDGKQALEQAIKGILSVPRYEHLIYSWNYGHELRKIIGKDTDYAKVEAQRLIKECLTQDDRISDVTSFKFKESEDSLLAEFEVETTLGTIESEVVI